MDRRGVFHAGIVAFIVGLCLAGGVRGDTFDVAWTFGNSDFFSYTLDGFSPADAGLGNLGAANPTLTLEPGKRYQVTVMSFTAHPLEIIAKGADSSQDIVLLSMGSDTGSFESDGLVQWSDDGKGTVQFTLTGPLYSAMSSPGHNPGYRCKVHVSTMRGDFAITGLPIAERIAKGSARIELQTVASGLAAPIDLKPSPDQTGRLFITDQAGKVYVIDQGRLLDQPFLDVTARLVQPLGIIGSHDQNDYDERGLLGLAIHPGFADPQSPGFGKVYTYTSEPVTRPADFKINSPSKADHQNVIAEWTVDPLDPNWIDPGTRREVLRIDHPYFNHNGGVLAFGPDGYLYMGVGDGGNKNDVGDGHGAIGNGQNVHTIQGSICRIDPLAPSAAPATANLVSTNKRYRVPVDNPFVGLDGLHEIFAYGFRNPFRFSFEQATGLLIVADVGQDHVEEIDLVVKGGNYGWNLKEGTFRFNPVDGSDSTDLTGLPIGLIDPVAEYDHDDGSAVIGGFLYRGSALPDLAGKYVFGDFSLGFAQPAGRLFYADLAKGQIQELLIGNPERSLGLYLKGFGQDRDGEIYVLGSSFLGPAGTGGVVLKIVRP